jgi:hypothetical protein
MKMDSDGKARVREPAGSVGRSVAPQS